MAKPKLKNRSHRISTNEGHKGSAVSYSPVLRGDGKEKAAAQILDVSSTGARLLSRGPMRAKVGDIVNVDFALEGSDYRIKSPARIVRQQNQFVFAVRFIGMKGYKRGVMDSALTELINFKRRAKNLAMRQAVFGWFNRHLLAVALVTVALSFAAFAFSLFF